MKRNKFSIQVKGWEDIPQNLRIEWLCRDPSAQSLYHLFISLMRHHKIPVASMDPSYLAECYETINWEFMNTPPLFPLFTGFNSYVFGEPKFKTTSGLEFQLAEHYYQEFRRSAKEFDLRCLFYTVARPEATYQERIVLEDRRVSLVSQTQVELLAASDEKIPGYILTSALMYVHANMIFISSLYGKVLTGGGGDGNGDGLGWTSTFMSIAESGIFGNLDSVYQTNIHTIMAYMVKKKVEHAEMENRMKKR